MATNTITTAGMTRRVVKPAADSQQAVAPSKTPRMGTSRLWDWSELPLSQQDGNSYIQSGYRPPAASVKECYSTWIYLHNETVNIFSHVFGSALFAILPFIVMSQRIPPRWSYATPGDKAVIAIYFAGVSICFAFSTVFHTLLCHRERKTTQLGMQLDFQGVLLLMWGATVPLIYYGFICDPKLRWIYWGVQTGLAVAASVFTLQPNFKDPSLKMLRALTFGGFACSSLVPIIHAIVRYGWNIQQKRMGLIWVFATLAFNTTGASAYAFKFPEAVWPRRFDILGCSHQILHVAVICAGITHMIGVLQAFDYLHDNGDTCPRVPGGAGSV